MNLPNKITFIRICFVPIILFFLLCTSIPNRYFFSLLFFVIASYTDYLDGYLARKNGLITNFGKFLDPLADKILVISILVCFVELKLVFCAPVILIIFREFMVTSLRIIAAEQGNAISANYFGKLKTVCQIVTISMIMLFCAVGEMSLRYKLGDYTHLITNLSNFMCWISAAVTIISGIFYVHSNKKVIK